MATYYINTASAGGDGTTNDTTGAAAAYASWNAFESARETTLTEPMTVYVDGAGGPDSSVIGISGFNTTAANSLTVLQNPAGSAYTLQMTATCILNENYIDFSRFTIETLVAGREFGRYGNPATTANRMIFEGMEFKAPASASTSMLLNFNRTNLNIDFINCRADTGSRVLDIRSCNAANVHYCSFVKQTNQLGVLANASTDVQNTYVGLVGGGGTDDFWTGGAPTGSNNASSDTSVSALGIGTLTGVLPEAVLTNTIAGSVDFHLVGGTQLEAAGTPVAGITTDYEGDPRDGTAPDIGADELVAADTTAPVFTVGPAVTAISETGGTASATIDETGDIFYVVVADGATAPTSAEVVSGTGSGGTGQLASGSALGVTAISSVFSGLSGLTDYDAYFVARDDEPTPNTQAAPTLVNFTTTDVTAPVLSAHTNVFTNTTSTPGAASSETGFAHMCMYLTSEATPPTDAEVIDGTYANAVAIQLDLAVTAATPFSFTQVTGLTGNTSYTVKIVAEDTVGNYSSAQTTAFTTQSANLTIQGIVGGANLTDLEYMVLSTQDLGTATIVKKGNGETTDASGNLTIDLNDSPVSNGQAVWYQIKDTTETHEAQGPGTVAVA